MNRNMLLLLLVLVLILCSSSILAEAQDSDAFDTEISPSKGTIATNITVRVSKKRTDIGDFNKADVFWDNVLLASNYLAVPRATGSYDFHFTVPTGYPLNVLGNHTIRLESYVSSYGLVNFSFAFVITEVSYTDLLSSYGSLLTDYCNLFTRYNELMDKHNALLANFDMLSSNYSSLLADSESTKSYTYQIYDSLITDYNLLNSSYYVLRANYGALIAHQDTTTRNLDYVLIATTVTFAAATVYLALRPKLRAHAIKLGERRAALPSNNSSRKKGRN